MSKNKTVKYKNINGGKGKRCPNGTRKNPKTGKCEKKTISAASKQKNKKSSPRNSKYLTKEEIERIIKEITTRYNFEKDTDSPKTKKYYSELKSEMKERLQDEDFSEEYYYEFGNPTRDTTYSRGYDKAIGMWTKGY
jgi:hypothetical protein